MWAGLSLEHGHNRDVVKQRPQQPYPRDANGLWDIISFRWKISHLIKRGLDWDKCQGVEEHNKGGCVLRRRYKNENIPSQNLSLPGNDVLSFCVFCFCSNARSELVAHLHEKRLLMWMPANVSLIQFFPSSSYNQSFSFLSLFSFPHPLLTLPNNADSISCKVQRSVGLPRFKTSHAVPFICGA